MDSESVSRVILISDGDFNINMSDNDSLAKLIRKKRKTGAYFSAIGTGIYNLMDDKLNVLAENGNGNYFVVNSLDDADNFIRRRYEAFMFPIAKNVKAMVEFNPRQINEWKLMGYENRMLEYEEFRDDSVTADPFGSGGYFVALFQVRRNSRKAAGKRELKYQDTVTLPGSELGTLTLRYEDIGSHKVKELEFVIGEPLTPTENTASAVRCALYSRKFAEETEDELARKEIMRLVKSQW